MLQQVMGLGNPVIYDTYPLYGYRPLPDREYSRVLGAKIKFNNLALRSETDWDANKDNKILFLGDSVTYGGSRTDNSELFTYLAVQKLGGKYISGNAGVNAWGVENIHGLIMDTGFFPAKTYVTTVPERDFYRGLVRFQGLPFYNKSPGYALAELWYLFVNKQNSKRYVRWQTLADEKQTAAVVEKAVSKLKKMDTSLKEKGYRHLIFISPTKDQVLDGAKKDLLLQRILAKHDLTPYYILNEINNLVLSDSEKLALFYDQVHLNKPGHALWADIIGENLLEKLR